MTEGLASGDYVKSRRTGKRGVHAWLKVGCVVMKGQKGIRLVAPDTIDAAGRISSIKPIYVFDVTQTQERTARAA